MDFAPFQEQTLRESAFSSGEFAHLLFYYAVKRDFDAVHALEARLDPENVHDALVHDVIALHADPERAPATEARLDGQDDLWLFYSLAKCYLGQGQIEAALRVARTALKADPRNSFVLNLVVKYAHQQGDTALARQLAEAALRVNPLQEDVRALETGTPSRAGDVPPLYLDVLPKWQPLSFYLPVYNMERYLRQSILGLAHQSYPFNELLLINDATPDRSMDIARQFPVRIIEHPENRGLAAARNTAFQNATTSYLGAVDSDGVAQPDYTKFIMMELENAAPDIAGAGGPLHEPPTENPADRWRATGLMQSHGPLRGVPRELFGCSAILHRATVLDAGGYDERCRTNSEDFTLAQSLAKHGRQCIYSPTAIVTHLKKDTLHSVLRASWNWCYWGRHQAGGYQSLEAAITLLNQLMEREFGRLAPQHRDGDPLTLYISFLNPFYFAFHDIRHYVELGLLQTAQGRQFQDALTQQLHDWDKEMGGTLGARAQEDLGHLLLDPGNTAPDLDRDTNQQLQSLRTTITTGLAPLTNEIYQAIQDAPA